VFERLVELELILWVVPVMERSRMGKVVLFMMPKTDIVMEFNDRWACKVELVPAFFNWVPKKNDL